MDSKPIVFATSGTREGMEKMLREFYKSPTASFDADGFVSNGTRILDGVRVVIRKKRFYFEKP